MFVAHIGVGLAAKRAAPSVSLGVLLLAADVVDVLCGVLMVTGIERMRASPGITRMTPLEFISYPWSHGLLTTAVWSMLAAVIAVRVYRSRRAGAVVGLLVFSHWVLDWISHRPDLPLLWDGAPKVGLGLWNSVAGTLAVELVVLLAGALIYVRSTSARDRVGTWSLVAMVVFFLGAFALNHAAPPPPVGISQRLLALPILSLILLLPWGHWIDRHRVVVHGAARDARRAARE